MKRYFRPTPIFIILLLVWCAGDVIQGGRAKAGGKNRGRGQFSLTAPGDQQITHNLRNEDQRFKREKWVVEATVSDGVTFTLEADSFVHQTNSSYSRPIKLSLNEISSTNDGRFTVLAGDDDTIKGSPAEVRARSNKPVRRTTFGLTTTFVESTTENLAPAGTYSTTIQGTLTAN